MGLFEKMIKKSVEQHYEERRNSGVLDGSANVFIKIEQNPSPQYIGTTVKVKDALTHKVLVSGNAGSVITLHIEEPTAIYFAQMLDNSNTFHGFCKIYPNKKYRASWGMGMIRPQISSCSEVDIIV